MIKVYNTYCHPEKPYTLSQRILIKALRIWIYHPFFLRDHILQKGYIAPHPTASRFQPQIHLVPNPCIFKHCNTFMNEGKAASKLSRMVEIRRHEPFQPQSTEFPLGPSHHRCIVLLANVNVWMNQANTPVACTLQHLPFKGQGMQTVRSLSSLSECVNAVWEAQRWMPSQQG